MKTFRGAVILCLSLLSHPLLAGETHSRPSVVPDHERAPEHNQLLQGPTENKGIKSVLALGNVALEGELASLAGKQLRAREITLEPGGVVAVHQHQGRPGIAYILEGQVVEHRSDHAEPIHRKVGAVAVEKTGLSHWWENKSDQPMRALVIDIVPTEP